jgi:hypothetical protein
MTSASGNESLLLAYLDHNILDGLIKGDTFHIKDCMAKASLVPAYSSETLNEIRRSTGHEHEFLKVLETIGALYLEPILDQKYKPTGQAKIHSISPFDIYDKQAENATPISNLGYGLTGMLQKMYGGHKKKSFGQIFEGGANELKLFLKQTLTEMNESQEIDEEIRSKYRELVSSLPQLIEAQYNVIADHLDSKGGNEMDVRTLDNKFDLGPKILNNIQGPNVLIKIWDIVQDRLPGSGNELEALFGLGPDLLPDGTTREKTIAEKVNLIYHQLNFFGYYRDSKLHKERRFQASFSDMTHAGMASFCNVFMSADVDMVMKTHAAYEHVGAKTLIALFKP